MPRFVHLQAFLECSVFEPCICTFEAIYSTAYHEVQRSKDMDHLDKLIAGFYVTEYYDIPLFVSDKIGLTLELIILEMVCIAKSLYRIVAIL